MRVLDIEVRPELARDWVSWLAPASQPFLVDPTLLELIGRPVGDEPLCPELRDTYEIYGSPSEEPRIMLTETDFAALDADVRRRLVGHQRDRRRRLVPSVHGWRDVIGDRIQSQAGGHRFVWWPSLVAGQEMAVLRAFLDDECRLPSLHDSVADATWSSCDSMLPGARELAGTFAGGSGPNCFGTVMASAGVPDSADERVMREPFERWLSAHTLPGGDDKDCGTVLVWRSADGAAQHAAITIGDSWALHKASQGWMTPRKVLAVDDVKRSTRTAGWRLQRSRLT